MLYTFLRYAFSPIFKSIYKVEVKGLENIPEKGPVVLIANHISLWDPVVLSYAIPKRQVYYMAKEELFKIPLLSFVIKRLGAFPVKRGKGDRQAMKMANNILEEGKILGLFPEGTRSTTGELKPFQTGAAMLALKANNTIIPTALVGTDKIKKVKGCTITIAFGKPITETKEEKEQRTSARAKALTQRLQGEVESLIKQIS
ncbi:1-acyl-sn-glycerol-3-phosphate acyltransferase [Desulfitispora alkaliphila]|uniref:lysophospholipid acyltransferase family protein n=1 Tax=Desulfitispora alkaliphila TaxID=622674 RepID=UPI003D22E60F